MQLGEINNLKVLFFVGFLMLMACLKILFTRYFANILHPKEFVRLKENSLLLNLIVGAISTLVFSYFIHHLLGRFELFSLWYWAIVLLLGCTWLIKNALGLLFIRPFVLEETGKQLLNQRLWLSMVFLLLLTGLLALVEYSPIPTIYLIYTIIIVYLVVWCVSSVYQGITLVYSQKVPLNFYILYLCTLEIAPWGVIYKLLIGFSLVKDL